MSYSINVSGHSDGEHNDRVRAGFENLVRHLRQFPGLSVGGSMCSSQNVGNRDPVNVNADDVKDVPA